MPYTSSPTHAAVIAIDDTARTNLAKILPDVQAAYQPPPRLSINHPPPTPDVVDEAYALTGCIRVGLNRWTLPSSQLPKPDVFEPRKGKNLKETEVFVLPDDLVRATLLSNKLNVSLTLVLCAAACTGLGMMAGDPTVQGPFEV